MQNFDNKFLVITGGCVDYDWAREWLSHRNYEYVIAADSGLEHADKLGIKVNFILGDYDSVSSAILDKYKNDTQVETYPCEKDFTDTHLAIITAIKQGAESIDVIGATGSRMDHAMTNIYVMKTALDTQTECAIYDRHNKIYLLDGRCLIKKSEQYGSYVSFVPMTENVVMTLNGFKYPLESYELKQGLSICQSNEIVQEHAEIIVENGIVVVFESRDK